MSITCVRLNESAGNASTVALACTGFTARALSGASDNVGVTAITGQRPDQIVGRMTVLDDGSVIVVPAAEQGFGIHALFQAIPGWLRSRGINPALCVPRELPVTEEFDLGYAR